jgi:hypothetical protein
MSSASPSKADAPAGKSPRTGRPKAPTIRELQAAGAKSLRDIATGLNERGIPTARSDCDRRHRDHDRINARPSINAKKGGSSVPPASS